VGDTRAHGEMHPLQVERQSQGYVASYKTGKYVWYFALALFAGIRPADELRKLAAHKELVDFRNRVIRISGAISKTGKPRQIKLRPNLYEWLISYPAGIVPVNAGYGRRVSGDFRLLTPTTKWLFEVKSARTRAANSN
jgi:hypothetical protein